MSHHSKTHRFAWLATIRRYPRRCLLGALLPAIAVLVVARTLPHTYQGSMVVQINPQWITLSQVTSQQAGEQLAIALADEPEITLHASNAEPGVFKLSCQQPAALGPAKILLDSVAFYQQHLRGVLLETLDQKQAALNSQVGLAQQQFKQARQARIAQQIKYPHLLNNSSLAGITPPPADTPDAPDYQRLIEKRDRLTEQQAILTQQLIALKQWVASQPDQIRRQLDRPNPLVAQLASRQLQLEAQIDRLQNSGAHATASHPQVIRLNKRIEKLTTQIAGLDPTVPYELEQTQNIERLKAQKQVQLMGGQLKAVADQLAQTQSRLATFATDNQQQLKQFIAYQRLRGKADLAAWKLQAIEKQMQVITQQRDQVADASIDPMIILQKPSTRAPMTFPSLWLIGLSVVLLPLATVLLIVLRSGPARQHAITQQVGQVMGEPGGPGGLPGSGGVRILGAVDRFQTSSDRIRQRLVDWLVCPALGILFLALLLPMGKAHLASQAAGTAMQTQSAPVLWQSPASGVAQ